MYLSRTAHRLGGRVPLIHRARLSLSTCDSCRYCWALPFPPAPQEFCTPQTPSRCLRKPCRRDSCCASCLSLGHKHLLPCLIPSAKGVLLSPVNATRAHVAPRCSICPLYPVPRVEALMGPERLSSTLLNHQGLLWVVRGFRISENENVLP